MAAVFYEDFSACLGVLLASAGLGLTQWTGNPIWDSLASIGIGGLLGAVAFRLVNMNKQFLLGQAVDRQTVDDIKRMILARGSIESVRDVQSQWLGPSTFAFKAEVDFDGTFLSAKLLDSYASLFQAENLQANLHVLLAYYAEDVTRLVERELKDLEKEIRRSYPQAVFIEFEPDSDQTDRQMVQYAQDHEQSSSESKDVFRHLLRILHERHQGDTSNPHYMREQQRLQQLMDAPRPGQGNFDEGDDVGRK